MSEEPLMAPGPAASGHAKTRSDAVSRISCHLPSEVRERTELPSVVEVPEQPSIRLWHLACADGPRDRNPGSGTSGRQRCELAAPRLDGTVRVHETADAVALVGGKDLERGRYPVRPESILHGREGLAGRRPSIVRRHLRRLLAVRSARSSLAARAAVRERVSDAN